jgi:predicted amidohydrolase
MSSINIGIAQIRNTASLEENHQTILKCLERFKEKRIDLVVFPECGLSGFTAKMQACTQDILNPIIADLAKWSSENRICLILPTAVTDRDGKIFNSGFFINGYKTETFYKLGLTQSEKGFFSVPSNYKKEIYEHKDFRFMPLICKEAQDLPWTYFTDGELDFILWPGYWGWTKDEDWHEEKIISANMDKWKIPLIQSNFSYNDKIDARSSGPHGQSVVIDRHNTIYYRAGYDIEECFKITLEKTDSVVNLISFEEL